MMSGNMELIAEARSIFRACAPDACTCTDMQPSEAIDQMAAALEAAEAERDAAIDALIVVRREYLEHGILTTRAALAIDGATP